MTAITNDVFELPFNLAENVSVAGEMLADADFDTNKVGDSLADVFKSIGDITYPAWESVRMRFVHAYAVRARDNGRAANPEGAADDAWGRMAKYLAGIHGIKKPASKSKDAERMAEKREAERIALMESVAGKSASVLREEQMALYKTATPEAIAQAKALDKAIKVVDKAEKDAVEHQMKPLIAAANDQHKAVMEFMKAQNDPALLGDYVVLLKETLGVWLSQVPAK